MLSGRGVIPARQHGFVLAECFTKHGLQYRRYPPIQATVIVRIGTGIAVRASSQGPASERLWRSLNRSDMGVGWGK
jgi:hypothetical protein